MKMTPFKSALACAVAFFAATALHAQTTVGQDGDTLAADLILSFATPGGDTGSGYNLEVDLGPIANFVTGGSYATGAPVSLSQLVVADLATTTGSGSDGTGAGFGSSRFTSGNVYWSVVGAVGSGGGDGYTKYTIFGTATAGSSAPTGSSQSTQTGPANKIVGYAGDLGGEDVTANSNYSAFLATTDSLSFTSQTAGASSAYFGEPGLQSDFETAAGNGDSETLYAIKDTSGLAGTALGNFTLSSSGLTFQAVPEPSTWASIVLGAATLIGFSRRRRRA